ncbi:hypothetical protein [Corallococcus llansteffanensis]|uniref:hypothetical protein n=1 Tax=Corallococcus llansteffanensis TaxID=2316731 RepID=UPI001ABF9B1D|nr:hypothetical protein [Corallococcus llansteffanensis]
MPPDQYARAAVDAALHVQVEIERVELPPGTSGEAVVMGRVARVFRGPPEMLSSRISFEVSCLRENDDSPPSGTLWKRVEDLEQAKVIETYLDRDGQGGFHVPRWQSFIIHEVTDMPLFLVTEEEARRLEDAFGPPRTRARRFLHAMNSVLLVHGPVLLLGLGGLAAISYFVWTLVEWQRTP